MTESGPRMRPIRSLLWRRLPSPGAEYFTLWRDGDGWQLRGNAVAVLDERPVVVRYGVLCDANWRTTAVHIALRSGGAEQPLHLLSDAGTWTVNGRRAPELDGIVDVDLGITPATNALPMRRLRLKIGDTIHLRAVWVRFPDLQVRPLEQTYQRVGGRSYLYRSTSVMSLIDVDDLGLPVEYGDDWSREAVVDL